MSCSNHIAQTVSAAPQAEFPAREGSALPLGGSIAKARLVNIILLVACTLLPSVARAEPVISEFMASNGSTLADEDGAYSDWIEIYNPDSIPANLNGWFLTDTAKNKAKWSFPAVTIPAQGYIIVYASGKDRAVVGRPLHTNFSLDASGEYLALVRADGSVAQEFAPTYPAQQKDISYGITKFNSLGTNDIGFLATPTPGAPNSGTQVGVITETVSFSRAPGSFTDEFTVELTGASSGQQIRYVIAAPSGTGGTVAEPTATSSRYNGPITVSSSVIIKAAVFSSDKTVHGVSTVAQYVKVASTSAASLAAFTSNLPVLVLDDHGAGPLKLDAVDHDAWLYRYPSKSKNTPTFSAEPDVATPIVMTVRGTSSAGFPKKSYSLELHEPTGDKKAIALAGTNPAKKWVLVGPWYFDTTYIKNSFVYELSRRLGRWAAATQPVEVFFSTGSEFGAADYAGIYILTEKIDIDPQKVAIAPTAAATAPNADVDSGYLLKLDSADADEFGFLTTRDVPGGMSQVVVASAKSADLSQAQKTYIQSYVQQMEDTLVADEQTGFVSHNYLDFIDRPSWIDHHILNVFADNFDALERSAYFSKDRGGKLVAGPVWDFDRAFGAATYTATTPYDRWFLSGAVNFWGTGWWGHLAKDPEFMQDWIDRWQQLRASTFSTTNLNALADALYANVGAAAIGRDTARWASTVPAEYAGGMPGGYAEMRTWFNNRAAWIDQQFVAVPTVITVGSTITFTPAPGSQLAYTLDGSDPRLLGGKVAPNAVLTSAPLSVSTSANVHVRGYRADFGNSIPGSPWSSVVGATNSSPLTPAARLINISTRAYVGSTDDTALIAGISVTDSLHKGYLIRSVGPTLAAFGASNVLLDPQLSIRRSDGVEVYRNTQWQVGNDSATLVNTSRAVGAFALGDRSADSALLPQLSAGQYTVRVSSTSGQPGVALAELYETGTNGRTTNLSVRVNVQPGDGALIGGFVVQGPAYKRLLIRGIGPGLKAFGLPTALNDSVLTIYSGQNVVATNDAWSSSSNAAAIAAAGQNVGAFALANGSEDAAILITLPPGAYTVQVAGKNGAAGVALLEIYEVP